jgi:hypothetical protein
MKRLLLLPLVLMAGLFNAAHAELVVFSDDFSVDGPLLGSTPDVGGVWTITGTSVVSPLTVTGGSLGLVTTGQDAYAAFASQVPTTGGTSLATSFLLNVSAAQATGDYFLHLSDPAGTTGNFYDRVYARASVNPGFFNLGLASFSGTGSVITYGGDLPLGTPTSVISTWNFVDGLANDTLSLTVDSASYLTGYTWTGNAEPAAFVSAVNIRQGTAANAPTLTIDNLVVTSISVIPEPTSLMLVGSVAGALGWVRRRRSC